MNVTCLFDSTVHTMASASHHTHTHQPHKTMSSPIDQETVLCRLAQSRLRGEPSCRLELNDFSVATCLPQVSSTKCGFMQSCNFNADRSFHVGNSYASVYTCEENEGDRIGFYCAIAGVVLALLLFLVFFVVVPSAKRLKQTKELDQLTRDVFQQTTIGSTRARVAASGLGPRFSAAPRAPPRASR